MKIQVLGVGGCFSPEIGNSSIILWDKGIKGFLIDCGYTVYPLLKDKKLIERIDKVFITHRHGDHIGSLDSFLFHKRYICNQKVKFYGVTDHLEYLKMIDPSFEKEFDEFFDDDKKNPIQIIPTKHKDGVPSNAFYNFGLLYSGDTSESLLDTAEARDAKIILHEVSFNDAVTVHAHFNALARAPDDIKRKTLLYHYNVGEADQFESKIKQHGFRGFLKQGQTLEF